MINCKLAFDGMHSPIFFLPCLLRKEFTFISSSDLRLRLITKFHILAINVIILLNIDK